MNTFRLVNPFHLGDPHPDPEIRTALAREYVRREFRMTYSAQAVDVLLIVVGLWLGHGWITAIGVLRVSTDGFSRTLMRRFRAVLDDGADLDPAIRRRVPCYLFTGFSWGFVAWPTMLAPEYHATLAILPVISVVSAVIMSTTCCFVPEFFRANYLGFALSMIPFVGIVEHISAVVIVLALPVLQFLVWDMARSEQQSLADMLTMQFERDKAISAQARVIDELDAAREHATHLAATDTVTQLPNRQAFLDHVDTLIGANSPFTLVLLDLDYFKNVNDTMGHNVGDAVLVAMASTLRETETEATFIARLGGDELALVLPDLAPCRIQRRFDAWLARFAQLQVPGVGVLTSSVTAGSARFPVDGGDRRSILNAADMALRTAKSTLRGTHQHFQHEMTGIFNTETLIANLLSRSIDQQLFDVFVQPQVRMDTGQIVAGEVLTRFIDPRLASFPVQAVFDVAEERGLGRRLSDVLLEKAAQTVLHLAQRVDNPVPLSINLSPTTLKLPDLLLERLGRWIAIGVDPRMVTLEITEDAISGRGLGHVEDTLATISQLGYALALDDFGTGHSSLAHLHTLPIDELKIPKEFVDAVPQDRKDQAIVRSALAMCEHLSIRCVVEGVETTQQRDTLIRLGASVAQGHLWSTPMPLAEFVDLLSGHVSSQIWYSAPTAGS